MQPDLIVFSHLRWTWVWQRPQHLVSRLARDRRVWFVEEPLPCDVSAPQVRVQDDPSGITRVWLEIPGSGRHVGFEDEHLDAYGAALERLVGSTRDSVVWLYSPLPIDLAASLNPLVIAYDVMDDLASFMNAPQQLTLRHRRALHRADVVFAGGRTLHRGVARHRPDAQLFPSGVEPEHYAQARQYRRLRLRPVAGYVGVIDERVDLNLIAEVARALPDWDIDIVGPVAKIDETSLPTAPNLRYPGAQPYERLPQVMGGFDVALMPFAINEATRSISPTKTLEYLAAGLPVVSTSIADVVADFGSVVDIADDPATFAAACRRALGHQRSQRDRKVRPLLLANHWDTIADRMGAILAAAQLTRITGKQGEISA